jgi:flagellar biosynthesis/type III secretory pathway protein FliH
MILRNAVVSDQRRTLEAAPRPLSAAVQVAREMAAKNVTAQESGIDPVPMAAVADAPPAAPPRENRLSLESVAAWLAIQDSETRSACASMLADELVQVHEAARSKGFAAGNEEARAEVQRVIEQEQAVLQALANSAEAALEQESARVGELCVEIVAEALTKIAGPLLSTREAVTGAVVEILRRVREGRELTIRVCHADLPLLQQEEATLARALPGRKFTLVADSRVDLGGCIVESRLGSLDGRLEVQLRELYATLRTAKSSQPELS